MLHIYAIYTKIVKFSDNNIHYKLSKNDILNIGVL